MSAPSSSALGDVLLHTARAYRRVQRAAELELPPHLARALRVVLRHEGLRIGHVAELLHVSQRSAAEAVDALVQRELVTRTTDPTDRRAQLVVATPAAQTTFDRVEQGREAAAREFFARLAPEDRQTVVTLLLRVDSDPRPGARPARAAGRTQVLADRKES